MQALWVKRRRRPQADGQRAAGENRREAFTDRCLPRISRRQAALAFVIMVREGDRLHRAAGFHRRLQQRAVEVQQMRTFRRGAFRKNRHVLAGIEQPVDFRIDDSGVTAAAAPQENRIGMRCEPADQRPVAYFGFGDEGHRAGRVERVDVEPGNMVGDHQAARFGAGQLCVEANGQDVEQLARPALLELEPSAVANERVNAGDRGGAPQEVQAQSRAAQCPNQARRRIGVGGTVQPCFPMKCLA